MLFYFVSLLASQYVDNLKNKKQHRQGVLLKRGAWLNKPKNMVCMNKNEKNKFFQHKLNWGIVFIISLERCCLPAPLEPKLTL